MVRVRGDERNGYRWSGKRHGMWSPIIHSCVLDRDLQMLHYKQFLEINHVIVAIVLVFCVY